MPKLGMEPIRRKALIGATIAEIGAHGSLDVTVGQIAKRAGVSSALAHHYFGGKDDLLLAAMRKIMHEFSTLIGVALAETNTPLARIEAIISACFHPSNFEHDVIAAWLTFYVQAQSSKPAARLLRIYTRRLHSNLVFNLRQLTSAEQAEALAQGLAAMIDGFYIRHALASEVLKRQEMTKIVCDYLARGLSK